MRVDKANHERIIEMEINLNNSANNAVGMRRESTAQVDTELAAKVSDKAASDRGAVTITRATSGLASAEPVADVPDAALVRDDDLGRLVGAAFNLPPPPMPDFS